MHPNPAFRRVDAAQSLALVRARSFGILVAQGAEGPLASHIPFMLSDDGSVVEFHLVRNSAMARAIADGAPVRLIVDGPEGYISPDWYGVADQVPTWNYVAVHLVGEARLSDEDGFRDLLDRLSAHFEARLLPKKPWTSDKMAEGVMERMMRGIVPCVMRVSDLQSTWKLGQNKTEDARAGAAKGLEGQGNAALANLMRNPPA
ncbi:FMN-binding negative transcriptional regulator [Marivita sp.]|jgi:transcriptional regulator|uniref:FMN-binding negative transcriptional regulator n=1 Tax=Marivita sp. TaxID=2003365 RepID=UPI00261F827E|nr:FMN-binding negative transcriptional regulator [Marivita sp.]